MRRVGPAREAMISPAGPSAGSSHDIITDFSTSGGYLIHLAVIDVDSLVAGDQAFAYAGEIAPNGMPGPGQLGWYQHDGDTYVRARTLSGIFEVELTGLRTLTAGDFMLKPREAAPLPPRGAPAQDVE